MVGVVGEVRPRNQTGRVGVALSSPVGPKRGDFTPETHSLTRTRDDSGCPSGRQSFNEIAQVSTWHRGDTEQVLRKCQSAQ